MQVDLIDFKSLLKKWYAKWKHDSKKIRARTNGIKYITEKDRDKNPGKNTRQKNPQF